MRQHEGLLVKCGTAEGKMRNGNCGKGKSLELEQPQYFVDGRGTLQAKKGR